VPGLGGVWYAKQTMLGTLGLLVAERAREAGTPIRNIEVANAIEALACWQTFKNNNWKQDARLRGRTKLQPKGADFSFARVRQRNFYVTQPMRMSTVQALPSLGFATSDGVRFNSYRTTEIGRQFVDLACKPFRPYNRTVVDHLVNWVGAAGKADVGVDTQQLAEALSPLGNLPATATKVLLEGLRRQDSNGTNRRAAALDWMERVRGLGVKRMAWSVRSPAEINEAHWLDLQAGARFFAVRDAAIRVLEAVESDLRQRTGKPALHLHGVIPSTVLSRLGALSELAETYLATGHGQPAAATFCEECRGKERDVLSALVRRDGTILTLAGSEIVPIAEMIDISDQPPDDPDAPQASSLPLPPGISYRVANLYLLNLDLHGELATRLMGQQLGGDR
jgi:hypothetical protein